MGWRGRNLPELREGVFETEEPVDCQNVAAYRIDVVRASGSDHAFACEDHLKEVLVPTLKACRGNAARVSITPPTSEEPCELGVE